MRTATAETTVAVIERSDVAWRVALYPFDDETLGTVVAHALHVRALVHDVLEAVCNEAEGNPLLAEELLAIALETPAGSPLALPPSVQAVTRRRLSQLDAFSRTVLIHAAAIGRRFDADLLAAIVARPVAEIAPILRRALDLHLLVEERSPAMRLAFRHALVREAVYAQLLAVEAQPLHARIATALEERADAEARLPERAYHWWAAGVREPAARTNAAAGDAARALHAYADAAVHYRRALEFTPKPGPERATLLSATADVLMRAWRATDARRALEELFAYYEAAGDRISAARIALRLAVVTWNMGDFVASYTANERACELAEADRGAAIFFDAYVSLAAFSVHDRRDPDKALALLAVADTFEGTRESRSRMYFHE